MKNKLPDLHNYLFAQLERLDDETKTPEELATEIERGRAITEVAAQIIANGNLQLKVLSVMDAVGIDCKRQTFNMLGCKIDGQDKKA